MTDIHVDSPPPAKKRRLRPLGDAIAPKAGSKMDDPAQHQGRTRSQPHVSGQWPAHVFIEVTPSLALSTLLEEAKASLPSAKDWHGFSEQESLHVSLSKPLYVPSSQRPVLRRSVDAVAKRTKSLRIAFATLASLANDESTRSFLAVEVGSGHDTLVALVKTLETELQDLKLPPYYDPPRFHASFAWRLIAAEQAALLDATTLDELNEQCGERLRRETMLCSTICLKIGKQVERWTLM